MGEGKAHYYVLFVQTLKQWEVCEAIRRKLPEGKGVAFYPCAERWMRSLGRTVVQPLFPGYVFIRSSLPRREIHEYIRRSRRDLLSFIRELRLSTDRLAAEQEFDGELTDLAGNEAELLDFMLGSSWGGFGEKDPTGIGAGRAGKGKEMYPGKLPEAGVLGMSRGYKDSDGSYVVMEGPLAGHGDRIVDVSPRDRVAWLNIKVGGKLAKVGLELLGKQHWFPGDRDAPVVLGDGSIVSLAEVAAGIMRPKHRAVSYGENAAIWERSGRKYGVAR